MLTRIYRYYLLLFVFAAIVFATGCATQSTDVMMGRPPGFLNGLLHGFIILFSFIATLFTEYEIYSFPNSGGWYDFGFLLGVMMFFGGGGAGARRS
jgi:hypothetical protein